MKTIEQIQQEIPYADVMTLDDFIKCVKCGGFIPYDGVGYYHDGEKETEVAVSFNVRSLMAQRGKHPYVCWYNK